MKSTIVRMYDHSLDDPDMEMRAYEIPLVVYNRVVKQTLLNEVHKLHGILFEKHMGNPIDLLNYYEDLKKRVSLISLDKKDYE